MRSCWRLRCLSVAACSRYRSVGRQGWMHSHSCTGLLTNQLVHHLIQLLLCMGLLLCQLSDHVDQFLPGCSQLGMQCHISCALLLRLGVRRTLNLRGVEFFAQVRQQLAQGFYFFLQAPCAFRLELHVWHRGASHTFCSGSEFQSGKRLGTRGNGRRDVCHDRSPGIPTKRIPHQERQLAVPEVHESLGGTFGPGATRRACCQGFAASSLLPR
mmetsp:Transcript_91915/g.231096  ORF Transcript_91915/g.231096 Transcript_91915/m.231096 type:complete len:213 (-) Transcript_91915:1099-1737(-)